MEFLDLPGCNAARGTVRLPGSKSISNRVLLLAALAEGVTEVHDLLDSDDTRHMLAALRELDVGVEDRGGNHWRIHGVGGTFPVKQAELFLGNAGTAFRPLTAALALCGGDYELKGVARMHERPIGDLVDALKQLGAQIDYLGNPGFPPLHIHPATLAGDRAQVRGNVSSQFLTGLLMALPLRQKNTTVEVLGDLISKPYIGITLAMLRRFGVEVAQDGWASFTVAADARYRSPGEIYVEGDASSASYFLAAGAIGGGPVRVEGVGADSVQGDVRFADALALMGARITMGPNWIEARAPASGQLNAIDLDCNHIPDAAMTLAVAALFADGVTTLRNIASWRVKETDRIAAMAIELRKVGAAVEEGADFIRITPPEKLIPNAVIDTYDDHRMAMCLSLVSLGGVPVRINDPACVNKTFPEYFKAFAGIVQMSAASSQIPVIAIDGPSASGKGTVAERVARALGFHFLDSGALYRLTALSAMKHGVALDDEAGVAELAGTLPASFHDGAVWLEEANVTEAIRAEAVGEGASKVAALPAVRAALLDRQRAYRQPPGLVADGRDMGTVVFPDAATKIFLTASASARAERRYKQLIEKGNSANLPALVADMQARDARDTARAVAPLKPAPDALLLDTTEMDVVPAVEAVLAHYALCEARGKQGN
ncbi:MAG: 3-phosphoshikimate 1-carboxyvinyltransferase [Pseudomonadota bacterium]|nr:3-phosphoshikimate 1-carboxyvinyltransferase [Pseudomonadota bacterium]